MDVMQTVLHVINLMLVFAFHQVWMTLESMHVWICLYNFKSQSFICGWCMCLRNGQRAAGVLAMCVWVCLSSSGSEIMNVVTQTSQQCIAVGSGSSQGYPTVMNHSLIWERDRGEEREVWRKQQLQYSPSRTPENHSVHTPGCVCMCVCVWTYGRVCTNSSLPLTFSISAKLSIQLWPITYNDLIEAVWTLLHLSSSDSWVSANEMILILRAVHVLCAVVNCVIICTVHTSLHAYSRWCVEGVDEGERYVWMLQFTLAV